MLELLRIKNLALIDDLELEFAAGLNVITGETGAGKSFILKAVNFLTGERLPGDIVRPGAEKAMVEALFAAYGPAGEDLVLRRELSAETGRSRLYINGELSSLESVEALRPKLLLHVSQHGQQRLLSPAYQAQVIDSFATDGVPLARRDELLGALRAVTARRQDLDQRLEQLAAQRDFLEFQRQEIAKVNPLPDEEEELLARREELRSLAASRKSLENVLEIVAGGDGGDGLAEAAAHLGRELSVLARNMPELQPEAEQCAEIAIFLTELERTLRRTAPAGSGGPREAEAIEARLYALAQLKRKLKRDLADIVSLRSQVEENLSFLDAAELDRKALAREENTIRQELTATLVALHAQRQGAARTLTSSMEKELRGLGFSEHIRLDVSFGPKEIFPGIIEQVGRILWVPNPGQPPQPLDRIASGGELSRFLLALTGLMARDEKPTLIFDEVDAGIGGVTLTHVAERIKTLSSRQQVLLITHWPQLAAKADRHFQVIKEVDDGRTTTRCRRLQGQETAKELTRMAGGGREAQALAQSLLAPSSSPAKQRQPDTQQLSLKVAPKGKAG